MKKDKDTVSKVNISNKSVDEKLKIIANLLLDRLYAQYGGSKLIDSSNSK